MWICSEPTMNKARKFCAGSCVSLQYTFDLSSEKTWNYLEQQPSSTSGESFQTFKQQCIKIFRRPKLEKSLSFVQLVPKEGSERGETATCRIISLLSPPLPQSSLCLAEKVVGHIFSTWWLVTLSPIDRQTNSKEKSIRMSCPLELELAVGGYRFPRSPMSKVSFCQKQQECKECKERLMNLFLVNFLL